MADVEEYELLVLGGGKAGKTLAMDMAHAGRRVIRGHWSEILRIIASIRTGTVTASLIMRQLASHPRQNGLAAALRELGRMARTLFMYVKILVDFSAPGT